MDASSEIAFAPALAAALLLVFVLVYQRRLLAQQQHLRTAEATYQRELLAALVEVQERERERIGRDLHDGIGSTIATAKLLVNRLHAGAPAAEATGLFALVKDIMAGAVHDVRSVSHSLYPAVLAHFGLAEAVQHLIDVSNEAGSVPITLALHYPRPLAPAQELALYRICQELLHNALKHAQGATELRVTLEQHGPLLVLTVADDGCGYQPAPQARRPGLRSIEGRVQLLQARLHQWAAPGQGTLTRIELENSLPT